MKETILIIGTRRKCYKAAIELGYEVLVWSNGPLTNSRKKGLKGFLEVPYSLCSKELSSEVKNFLTSNPITRVIANSEESVILGARARKHLGLKPLGYNVVERFHNKFVMKNSAKEANIPITNYEMIDEKTNADQLIESLGLPVVIKPVDESGAQDIKVARNKQELEKMMKPGLLAESFVVGSELSVETFVQNGEPIFHNFTEYLHQWRKSAVPAQIDNDLKARIIELNDKVIKHFKLNRGMTHAEFYLTKDGPVFGEIAVRPPGGYYMDLIQKVYGFDSWKTYVQLSCGKNVSPLNQTPNGHAAVVIFHPGAGQVVSIEGLSDVKKMSSQIIDLNIRVNVGDTIKEHTNTSNEVGHILFWNENRSDLISSISYVENNVKILTEPAVFDSATT